MTEDSEIDRVRTDEERALGEHLHADRPVPSANFRGALGRYLVARDPGYGSRPSRLRLISGGCVVASAVLLALGALQATGTI
jgi:hypothetical protein